MNEPAIKVLLIEDDPDDVGLIRDCLAVVGEAAVRLEQEACLTAGLARLAAGGFDAVLLDLGLPESSGLETLRLVYPRFPNLPIVVLTGLDVDEVGVEAVKAGAQDYVAKHRLDGHLLVRTLRYALERARRQQAELALHASRRALRQTDARLRNLVENIPDHVAVLAPDGRILFVNRSTPMASVDELTGANTFDFVASEHREQYRGVFQRAVDTGQVQSNVVMTIHGRWWEIRLVPVAEEKTVQTVTVIGTDITERRLAEENLRASEGKLHTISDAALDAVVMMDADGRVAHWNPAAERMFGYRHDEIMGRSIHSTLVPQRYREQAASRLVEFLRTGQGPAVGRVLELDALREDGSEFPVEISVSPIRLENRWCAVAIVRDITARREAEEAVAGQQRQLRRLLDVHERDRQLLAYEVHDALVQPLTGALMNLEGSLQNLGARLSPSARQSYEGAVDLLRRSIHRARHLMDGLRPPILDQFGILSAIENLACEIPQGGPDVAFTHDVEFQRLAAPLETAIFRVAQEGLANARRHSRSGQVRIGLRQQGDCVRLEIEDFGVGFDTAGVPPGCFGLEGIRERARLFGGTALIDSAPGRGTRLVVEFPLVEGTPDDLAAPQA